MAVTVLSVAAASICRACCREGTDTGIWAKDFVLNFGKRGLWTRRDPSPYISRGLKNEGSPLCSKQRPMCVHVRREPTPSTEVYLRISDSNMVTVEAFKMVTLPVRNLGPKSLREEAV